MKEACTRDNSHLLDDRDSDAKWQLVFDLFTDSFTNAGGAIGAYFVRLGGKVHVMVSLGGIGKESAEFREEVERSSVACLGFQLSLL